MLFGGEIIERMASRSNIFDVGRGRVIFEGKDRREGGYRIEIKFTQWFEFYFCIVSLYIPSVYIKLDLWFINNINISVFFFFFFLTIWVSRTRSFAFSSIPRLEEKKKKKDCTRGNDIFLSLQLLLSNYLHVYTNSMYIYKGCIRLFEFSIGWKFLLVEYQNRHRSSSRIQRRVSSDHPKFASEFTSSTSS